MTFEIQYSKNAKFVSNTMQKLDEQDAARFRFMLALKANILKFKDLVYKIKWKLQILLM